MPDFRHQYDVHQEQLLELRARIAQLEEALRWLFSNHVGRDGSRAIVWLSSDGKFVYGGCADKDIPTHLAAVIAEALK